MELLLFFYFFVHPMNQVLKRSQRDILITAHQTITAEVDKKNLEQDNNTSKTLEINICSFAPSAWD